LYAQFERFALTGGAKLPLGCANVQSHHDTSSHLLRQSARGACMFAARCIPLTVTMTPPAIGPTLGSKHISVRGLSGSVSELHHLCGAVCTATAETEAARMPSRSSQARVFGRGKNGCRRDKFGRAVIGWPQLDSCVLLHFPHISLSTSLCTCPGSLLS